MSAFHILLLTVVFVVVVNARQPCDDTDDCVDERHVCRGGFCTLPLSFRQLLVAANPIVRCSHLLRCPEDLPYCVNGQCKDGQPRKRKKMAAAFPHKLGNWSGDINDQCLSTTQTIWLIVHFFLPVASLI
uniref:Uncharacterized protein n=1 Tax=Ditylenchus dipsaci TaxID=166011 RepID=A0A915E7B9_9BILA